MMLRALILMLRVCSAMLRMIRYMAGRMLRMLTVMVMMLMRMYVVCGIRHFKMRMMLMRYETRDGNQQRQHGSQRADMKAGANHTRNIRIFPLMSNPERVIPA